MRSRRDSPTDRLRSVRRKFATPGTGAAGAFAVSCSVASAKLIVVVRAADASPGGTTEATVTLGRDGGVAVDAQAISVTGPKP